MTHTILHIDGSMRQQGSKSRMFANQLVAELKRSHGHARVLHRDLAQGVPFIDANWIDANFTDPSERSPEQRAVLSYSDALVDELRAADSLVLAVPIYNFGVPAAVKAWIDMVARAKETFRYTEHGPQGLLTGKKAYLVIVSGGTKAESEIDFATPYLKHALGFIGIHDVELIASHGGLDATDQIQALRTPKLAA